MSSSQADVHDHKKPRWTPEEDEQLKKLVALHGLRAWSVIAKDIPGRSNNSCNARWCHHLDPNVNRAPFTYWEDAVVIRAWQEHSNRWAHISKLLQGRTHESVRNRWGHTLKRKYEQQQLGDNPFYVGGYKLAELQNMLPEAEVFVPPGSASAWGAAGGGSSGGEDSTLPHVHPGCSQTATRSGRKTRIPVKLEDFYHGGAAAAAGPKPAHPQRGTSARGPGSQPATPQPSEPVELRAAAPETGARKRRHINTDDWEQVVEEYASRTQKPRHLGEKEARKILSTRIAQKRYRTERATDAVYKERERTRLIKQHVKRRENPIYKGRHRIIQKKYYERWRKDPAWRERERLNQNKHHERRRKDPAWRERKRINQKKRYWAKTPRGSRTRLNQRMNSWVGNYTRGLNGHMALDAELAEYLCPRLEWHVEWERVYNSDAAITRADVAARLGSKRKPNLVVHPPPELLAKGIVPPQDVVGVASSREYVNAKEMLRVAMGEEPTNAAGWRLKKLIKEHGGLKRLALNERQVKAEMGLNRGIAYTSHASGKKSMSWPDCLAVFHDGTAWISDPKCLGTMFCAAYSAECIAKCKAHMELDMNYIRNSGITSIADSSYIIYHSTRNICTVISGADLDIGDGSIAAYLRACLKLGQKPKAPAPFLKGAPPTSDPLADSPDGLLGISHYGEKLYSWGCDWRLKAAAEIEVLEAAAALHSEALSPEQ